MAAKEQKRKTYPKKKVKERAAEGVYDLINPLDYLILGKLVDEGELMGGFYPLATRIAQLKKEFKGMTADALSGRVRSMYQQGLTTKVKLGSSGEGGDVGWQRTQKGKEVYELWQQRQR